MRQAITTKFIGATNHRASRVKATASAGSITVEWDHDLNVDNNHKRAARKLAQKFGWHGTFHAGGLPSEAGNVYVCVTGDDADNFCC